MGAICATVVSRKTTIVRLRKSSYAASFIAMHDLQSKLSDAVNRLVNDDSTSDPMLRLSEILATMAKAPAALPEKKDMNAANKERCAPANHLSQTRDHNPLDTTQLVRLTI